MTLTELSIHTKLAILHLCTLLILNLQPKDREVVKVAQEVTEGKS